MMGLGVDDIFVMMACWRQIQMKYSHHSIPEKMALMLQHAGASVTVTSLTDVVAFSIGASTVRIFWLFCSTWFVSHKITLLGTPISSIILHLCGCWSVSYLFPCNNIYCSRFNFGRTSNTAKPQSHISMHCP